MKALWIIVFAALLIAAFLTGHRAGWQQHRREGLPEIDTEAKTIGGLLHQSPPAYYSIIVPEKYDRLDTATGRAAMPFHEVVFVISGSDTLGFFNSKIFLFQKKWKDS